MTEDLDRSRLEPESPAGDSNGTADAKPFGGFSIDFSVGGDTAPVGSMPISFATAPVTTPGGPTSEPSDPDRTESKVVIVGSGPAGLTAAIYAARANLEPIVIAGSAPGGQLMITSDVENYPGFPLGIQGPELMAAFREQAERFGA